VGIGFRVKSKVQTANVKLGGSFAGQVALDHKLLIIDLDENNYPPKFSKFIKEEQFVSYAGVPLIAKGQVLGVLEVYKRSSLSPDQEWGNFFETLANQAAIAIDNISLFNDLQRSNLELSLGYDQTIEGWAKTLEMRDDETEGHSQRVTDLTVQLARKMGVESEDLVHIRRGALLHDIGKINIPDKILLKEGSLDDEEWKIMRKHPEFAYEFLSKIKFLNPALEIPYYHHEKWDGTGYSHGLKGEKIPLAARIFSIVDVYDALLSDRPYRKAWSLEKTVDHIKKQSGIHFDPAIVDAFMRMQKH
jgi:putative nucleotidyltransferase with HDIG domain